MSFLANRIGKHILKHKKAPEGWENGIASSSSLGAQLSVQVLLTAHQTAYLYKVAVFSEKMPMKSFEYFCTAQPILDPMAGVAIVYGCTINKN